MENYNITIYIKIEWGKMREIAENMINENLKL